MAESKHPPGREGQRGTQVNREEHQRKDPGQADCVVCRASQVPEPKGRPQSRWSNPCNAGGSRFPGGRRDDVRCGKAPQVQELAGL